MTWGSFGSWGSAGRPGYVSVAGYDVAAANTQRNVVTGISTRPQVAVRPGLTTTRNEGSSGRGSSGPAVTRAGVAPVASLPVVSADPLGPSVNGGQQVTVYESWDPQRVLQALPPRQRERPTDYGGRVARFLRRRVEEAGEDVSRWANWIVGMADTVQTMYAGDLLAQQGSQNEYSAEGAVEYEAAPEDSYMVDVGGNVQDASGGTPQDAAGRRFDASRLVLPVAAVVGVGVLIYALTRT